MRRRRRRRLERIGKHRHRRRRHVRGRRLERRHRRHRRLGQHAARVEPGGDHRQHGRRDHHQHADRQRDDLRARHVRVPDDRQRARRHRVVRAADRQHRRVGRARQPARVERERRHAHRVRQVRDELHVGHRAHRRREDRRRAGEFAADPDHRRSGLLRRAELVLERQRAVEHRGRSRRERHSRDRARAVRLRRELHDVDALQQLLRVPERQHELPGHDGAARAAGRQPGAALCDRQQRRDRRNEPAGGRQRDGHADVRDQHPVEQRVAGGRDEAHLDDRGRPDGHAARPCDHDGVLRYRLERVLLRYGRQHGGLAARVQQQFVVLLPVEHANDDGHRRRPERRAGLAVDLDRQRERAVFVVQIGGAESRRPVRQHAGARFRLAALFRQDTVLRDGPDWQRRCGAVCRVLTRRARASRSGARVTRIEGRTGARNRARLALVWHSTIEAAEPRGASAYHR
ncbi:hypothetical protein BURPS1710b_0065 [Burkholderia pseudomallei 1710b]|uniref:Uncharacterized protein n=1 Tax=Burkholderia pseudomallei (strain 1710b) TaxID=320372 RepID=Q3JY71_BURP1|nr:hypothetical protein BURPS1710b_0065 [Burkholderia pseudomallei 1710b]